MRGEVLRYGENPHQQAALYLTPDGAAGRGLAGAQQLHGKAMSYNNYVDADAAWRAAHDHADPAVAIIKHANPCGIAVGTDVADAHAKAHACDPVSAFGGVIATNRTLTAAAAEQIAPVFTEVVVAPGFEPEALEILEPQEEHPAPAGRRPSTAVAHRAPCRQRRPARAGARPGRRPRRRPVGAGPWPRVPRPTTPRSPT